MRCRVAAAGERGGVSPAGVSADSRRSQNGSVPSHAAFTACRTCKPSSVQGRKTRRECQRMGRGKVRVTNSAAWNRRMLRHAMERWMSDRRWPGPARLGWLRGHGGGKSRIGSGQAEKRVAHLASEAHRGGPPAVGMVSEAACADERDSTGGPRRTWGIRFGWRLPAVPNCPISSSC